MFLDRVKITIKSGNGGNGIASFYRDKLTISGGPDGGDGGRGGDIVFKSVSSLNTLQFFQYKKNFVAENGLNGQKKTKTGKSGTNLVIEVPLGTVILDADTNKIIADLTLDNQIFIALKGGNGGKGNTHFATSSRQSPKFSQLGEKTKGREVILELKTIADVGIIGYPNAGKSTLLSVLTNAKPKIADYQFTTLYPNLGVVRHYENSFVLADIPELIEGASEGLGLGHYFLRHIERVRLLIHLVDISESEGRRAIDDYNTINKELLNYSIKLADKKQIVVLSKTDILSEEELAKKVIEFEAETQTKTLQISSISNKNLDKLKNEIWQSLKTIPKPEPLDIEMLDFDMKDKTSVVIEKVDNQTFRVSGGYIENLARGVVISDYLSFSYFQDRLLKDGIMDKLQERGLKDGDTIIMEDISFIYMK